MTLPSFLNMPLWLRHGEAMGDKDLGKAAVIGLHPRTRREDMAELAKQIIRQQWAKRHDTNANTRNQAIALIKTHVVMLREWRQQNL